MSPLQKPPNHQHRDSNGNTSIALPSGAQEESYEIIEVQPEYLGKPLGSGRSGQVFEYKWGSRQIAIKIFSDIETYQQELQAYCRISISLSSIHTHLPQFYGRAHLPDNFTPPRRRFTSTKPFIPYSFGIAMELIQGKELQIASPHLSNDRLQEIENEVTQLLKDLRDECSIIHGDIRDQNLLITTTSWKLIDLGYCSFESTLTPKQWHEKSINDNALCYYMFQDTRIVNAIDSGFLLLESSLPPSEIETQLHPHLLTIARQPSQAIPFINFVLLKLPHPTPSTSNILAQILRLLERFNTANSQIAPHISNPSTPPTYLTLFHNHSVAIAEARMQARKQLGLAKRPAELQAALSGRVKAFDGLFGGTALVTVKARHALWSWFLGEGKWNVAEEVWGETGKLLRRAKVKKESGVRKFFTRWERERMGVLEKRRR